MKPDSGEMRYEATGRTDARRAELIIALWRDGANYRRIAAVCGMSKSGAHYAIQRLRGRPRRRSQPADNWDEDEWYAPDSHV